MTTDGIGNIGKGLRNLGIWLAVGAFLVALVVSGTLEKIKTSDNAITVKGLAERSVFSDTAVWRAWYVVRGIELAPAYATLKQHG